MEANNPAKILSVSLQFKWCAVSWGGYCQRWEWSPIERLRPCLCYRWEHTMRLGPCAWVIAGMSQDSSLYCYSRIEECVSVLLPGLAHLYTCTQRTVYQEQIFNELNMRIAVSILWEKKFIVTLNSTSRSKYCPLYQSPLLVAPGCLRCLPQTP